MGGGAKSGDSDEGDGGSGKTHWSSPADENTLFGVGGETRRGAETLFSF
jgi:hypothetical protein